MQLIFSVLYFAFFFVETPLSGQKFRQTRQHDVRPDNMDQYRARRELINQNYSRPESTSHEISKTDTGLQRPVKSKKKGFGYQLGFPLKFIIPTIPLSAPSGLDKVSAGIWENSINNNFLLGAYDLRGSTFSPILSISYTNFNHFGHTFVPKIDFGSLNLNFAGIFTFGKGWSIRPSIGYTADFSSSDGMSRTYSQLSPAIALGKNFSIGKVSSFLDFSLGYTSTNSVVPSPIPDDLLDRFETSLTWGISAPFGNFEFNPYLRLALADYSNQSKTDFSGNLGLDLSYHLTDWMILRLYSTFSTRSSSLDGTDFTKLEAGTGASLSARF